MTSRVIDVARIGALVIVAATLIAPVPYYDFENPHNVLGAMGQVEIRDTVTYLDAVRRNPAELIVLAWLAISAELYAWAARDRSRQRERMSTMIVRGALLALATAMLAARPCEAVRSAGSYLVDAVAYAALVLAGIGVLAEGLERRRDGPIPRARVI